MYTQKKSQTGMNSSATELKQPVRSWVKLPMLFLIVAIGIVLVATTALAESPTAVSDAAPAVATQPAQAIYLSPHSGGKIDRDDSGTGHDLRFANEDILVCTPVANTASCNWAMYFDGSDVGLSSVNLLDFEILPDGNIIFTIDRKRTLPDVGQVKPTDVISFTPTSLGTTTTGKFGLYLKGDTVGLTKSGEAIDALAMTKDGKLVVSLTGSGNVPQTGGGSLSVKDEDLLQLDGTTWSLYLDGSTIKLTSSSEDIAAAWIDKDNTDHNIYVTTKGSFSASSMNSRGGKSTDILGVTPASSDPIASGFLYRYFDAKSYGFTKSIDGLFVVPATSAPTQQALVTRAADDSATAENADDALDMSEADPSDSELDIYDQIDVQATIFLPVVKTQ